MAYTPTQWNTGDDVTATKLNKMENGIANAGSALIVDVNENSPYISDTENGASLNKTFSEIYDALKSGVPVYVRKVVENNGPSSDYACVTYLFNVIGAYKYADEYRVYVSAMLVGNLGSVYYLGRPSLITFTATSASAYPYATNEIVPTNWGDFWD